MVIKFNEFKKRVQKFNPEYQVDPKSYINASGKVEVLHLKCGTLWNPNAKDLMEGRSNCSTCGGRMKWTKDNLESFSRIHKIRIIKFDDSKINSKATFICQSDHTFTKRPASFKKYCLEGNPCPNCSAIRQGLRTRKYKHEEISRIAKKRDYKLLTPKNELDSESFKLVKHNIKMQCPNNHICEMSFNNFHNNGQDCKICKKSQSVHFRERLCKAIIEDLTKHSFPEYTINKNDIHLQSLIKKHNLTLRKNSLSIDGYSERLNIAFEHHGQQHYKHIPFYHRKPGSFEKQKVFDKIKKQWCEKEGIKLIEIPFSINEKSLVYFLKNELSKLMLVKLNKPKDINYYKNNNLTIKKILNK